MFIMFKNVIDLVFIVDCQMEVEMVLIIDLVICLVKDMCILVSCCVDVGFMKILFEVYFILDVCNYWLDVGIEKLLFNFSLKDVIFGIFVLEYFFFLCFILKFLFFVQILMLIFKGYLFIQKYNVLLY